MERCTPSSRRVVTVAALVLLPFVGVACSDDDSSPAAAAGANTTATAVSANVGYQVITPTDGRALMQQLGNELTVLDVRTATEFATGHVEGAVNLDYEGGQLAKELGTLDPSKPYLVYCHSGRRAALAAQAMVAAGFTKVYDMGGIIDWQAAGLPVVTG